MRKLILFNIVSIDGLFEGPSGEIDWFFIDSAFQDFSINQLNEIDLLIFGRKTYELMAGYWTKPEPIKNDPIVAAQMNGKQKLVASRKLKSVEWSNSSLIKGNINDEISKLKDQRGKDIIILGSADLASGLINAGLIDEFRILISPIVLGKGNSQFKNIFNRLNLKLLRSQVFESGNVLLVYGRKDD